jgi:predicted nucleic-acid-binding protein
MGTTQEEPVEQPGVEPAAVETSLLVRYLVQDEPVHGAAATRVIEGDGEVAISGVALAETAFVLLRNYGVPREDVVDKLVALLRRQNVRLLGLDKTLAASALLLCRPSGRVSFADALINADVRSHGITALYTFDQQFPAEGLDLRTPA